MALKKDLSSKKLTWWYVLYPTFKKQEQVDPWGSLAKQYGILVNSPTSETHCLQNNLDCDLKNDT